VKVGMVKAVVHGCSPIEKVEIIKDGELAFCQEDKRLDISLNWQDSQLLKGRHFYYQVIQVDG